MKIKWGNTVIADTPEGKELLAFGINGQELIQVVARPRQAMVEAINRQNSQTTVTCSVTEKYSTLIEAGSHILRRYAELEKEDILELQATDGGAVFRLYMRACLQTLNAGYIVGVSIQFDYVFTGGALTTGKPE